MVWISTGSVRLYSASWLESEGVQAEAAEVENEKSYGKQIKGMSLKLHYAPCRQPRVNST